MKVKMLTVGKYSWDGSTLIVRKADTVCETVPNKQENVGDKEIHEGVAHQWIKMGVCKEIKPRVKKK